MQQLNRRHFGQAALAAALAGCGTRGAQDIILHGGPIYTFAGRDRHQPRRMPVEALRIRDGLIAFAGPLEDARTGARNTRVIDLAGAAAFPGFTDAHVHLTGVGMAAMLLDLVGVESIAAMQTRLRAYAQEHPQAPIIGRGWIETHWPERRFPTRADLDAVVNDRPVVLERIDGHAVVANSAALALARVEDGTPDPAGGRIERDAAGAATGMLIDNAASLVQAALPAPTVETQREALRQAARLYASRGWTGIGNMSTTAAELGFFRELEASGDMPLRANLYMQPQDAELARGASTDSNVRVRGVKLYMDGALGSRGAALLAPYSDMPNTSGLLVTPIEEVRDALQRAREGGYQAATHAIGDRANRLVLDVYRDVFADAPDALRAARWRIEHAQVISPDDIPRFGAMGVIASMQPSHAISDLHFAPARLGQARLAGAYAWRSLVNSDAMIAAGSDAPVEKGDPLIEFYAATHRHDLQGFAGPDWHLDQAIGRDVALQMLTFNAAHAAFDDDRGSIAVGQRADISVFSVDLLEAEPAAIPTAHPVLTISGGQITHEAL